MQIESPQLVFPAHFCCNCGDTNCTQEIQDTRVSRFFGLYRTETVFRLSVPICAACRRTTRRRPPGFFSRLSVFLVAAASWCLAFYLLGNSGTLPQWFATNMYTIGILLGAISALVFYRFRRPKPPQTSFYQPVRIKHADVKFAGVMGGPGEVTKIKLAFTNPDYLNAFLNANGEAVRAGYLAITKA
jgi:hypothetical protein